MRTSNNSFPFLKAGVSSQDAVELNCGSKVYCLNDLVQCQRNVTGLPLRWRVRDESMSQLGAQSYNDGDPLNDTTLFGGADEFTTVLLYDGNTFVSRLSFTLQSVDFKRYNVECEEAIGNPINTKSFPISIPGMFPLDVN